MWKNKLCLSTTSLNLDLKAQIKLFCDVGFDGFFVGWDPGMDVKSIREYADELGMLFQSIHAPFMKMKAIWGQDEAADEAVSELLDCLRSCSENEVPIMVCHGFCGFKDHTPTEWGLEHFGKVVDEAEKLGVKIAFENLEGEEYLAALMERFGDRKNVGFCWDTGHELCYNHGKDMLDLYGDKLLCTHLNDNLGIRDYEGEITFRDDLHLLPFDGIADWEDIARRLNRHGFDGPLTFELKPKGSRTRHENDCYTAMTPVLYVTEAYKRACRVAALKDRLKSEKEKK